MAKLGIEPPSEKKADSDRDKVEDSGGEGRKSEVMQAVEESHVNGSQGEKEDKGKEDAGEFDGEFDFSRNIMKSRIKETDQRVGE